MPNYDLWSAKHPRKRPDPSHTDPRRKAGDSIYDFAFNPPRVRPDVHRVSHREHDLSGKRALMSRRFIYFGRKAKELPSDLREIVKDGPGHKSASIALLEERFVEWLKSLGHEWGSVLAAPSDWPSCAELPKQGKIGGRPSC
jgi:hypothetical protein